MECQSVFPCGWAGPTWHVLCSQLELDSTHLYTVGPQRYNQPSGDEVRQRMTQSLKVGSYIKFYWVQPLIYRWWKWDQEEMGPTEDQQLVTIHLLISPIMWTPSTPSPFRANPFLWISFLGGACFLFLAVLETWALREQRHGET
jgi:hypothetical protein